MQSIWFLTRIAPSATSVTVPTTMTAPLSAAVVYRTTRACFVVRDQNVQALAYVYFEDEPGPRSAAKLLTRDEARAHS
jgi:hypothetical protein